jgi:hypothetical protein
LLPPLQGRFEVELLGESDRAVEHDPGHHLGVGEVAAWPPRFPDPVVRLTPDRLDVIDHRPPARPQPLLDLAGDGRAEESHTHHLAVDIELKLLGCRVPDPDRLGLLVARQRLELELGQAPLAIDSVHDLDRPGIARADPQEVVAEFECLLGVAGNE